MVQILFLPLKTLPLNISIVHDPCSLQERCSLFCLLSCGILMYTRIVTGAPVCLSAQFKGVKIT